MYIKYEERVLSCMQRGTGKEIDLQESQGIYHGNELCSIMLSETQCPGIVLLSDGKPFSFHPQRLLSGVLEVRERVQEDVRDDDEEDSGV